MADQVRVQTSVSFIQESPPATIQLMNTIQDTIPESHNHGVQNLNATTTDYQLATNINVCVLNCSNTFEVKVGSTTAPALTTKSFMYNGAIVDIFISNTTTEPINIEYMTSAV